MRITIIDIIFGAMLASGALFSLASYTNAILGG